MTENDCWRQLHVIGIDDSGPLGLPAAELRLVQGADLLCGGERQLALFPEQAAERLVLKGNLSEIVEKLAVAVGKRRAVVLASGDPCFYGIGPLLADRLGAGRVNIHPRPSSVAEAFARLGVAWQDARVLSIHGRPIEDAVPAALRAATLALLTDAQHTPAAIATALLAAGMEDCRAYVCERLGGTAERITATRLTQLTAQTFDPLNIVILLRESTAVAVPAFGRPDACYTSVRGQITKAETRAATLAALRPWRSQVLWDIGAGSGSVGIEAAGLMPGGAVYAVERDREQQEALRANIRRHRAAQVRVVEGAAPEALTELPDPDTIFIGGSGGCLTAILEAAATRLQAGGRLVANFALLDSLTLWQSFAGRLGWRQELVQLSVARGVPASEGTRLAPLSPVFITTLERPEDAG